MPSASLGRSSSRSSLRPLDMPVEDQLQRPVFRLPARTRRCGRCRRLKRCARARQPQLGRIELQVGEMDDAVVAALEVRWSATAGRRSGRGRSCCRAAAPRPWPCRRRGCPCCSGRARPCRSVIDVDDAEAGDQIALHRARTAVTSKRPVTRSISSDDLAVPFGAGEPEAVAAHQLGRDRQPAFDARDWRASRRRRRRCR